MCWTNLTSSVISTFLFYSLQDFDNELSRLMLSLAKFIIINTNGLILFFIAQYTIHKYYSFKIEEYVPMNPQIIYLGSKSKIKESNKMFVILVSRGPVNEMILASII